MFDIQVRTGLSRVIRERSHAFQVVGVHSGEHSFERRVRLSGVAEYAVRLIRPEEVVTGDVPAERPRMAQALSLGQVLPASLQIDPRGLRSTPAHQEAKSQAEYQKNHQVWHHWGMMQGCGS